LLELLVAITVGMALVWLSMTWLDRGGRLVQRLSSRTALQQETLLVNNVLAGDLARTTTSGISLRNSQAANDPTVLALHRLMDTAYSAGVFREDQIQIYCWRPAERLLYRKTYPPTPPDLGITVLPSQWCRCSAAQLLALANQAHGGERKLCRRVELWSVELTGSGVVNLRLTLQQGSERFESSRSFYLRNPSL